MSIRILIYNSLIKPHIEYGAAIWGPKVTTTMIKPLITLKKKAIRNICNTAYNSHTEALKKKHSIFYKNAPHNNLVLFSIHAKN